MVSSLNEQTFIKNFISYLKDRFNFPGIDLPPDLVIKLDVTIYTDANDYLLNAGGLVAKKTNLLSMSCGKASTTV